MTKRRYRYRKGRRRSNREPGGMSEEERNGDEISGAREDHVQRNEGRERYWKERRNNGERGGRRKAGRKGAAGRNEREFSPEPA